MQQSSKEVVLGILRDRKPRTILDAPCGLGWLRQQLNLDCRMDGVDLYATPQPGYDRVVGRDLDQGLPEDLPVYDCICSCEGIEHFGNPLLFLDSARRHLVGGGLLVITTPNVWYPEAKLKYLVSGFLPSFPCLIGRIRRGSHMHITPWSFPHLYLYLRLAGFEDIRLHPEPMSHCRHLFERLVAIPQQLSIRRKRRRATDPEEIAFWEATGTEGSVFGRHLIVTARRPVDAQPGEGA